MPGVPIKEMDKDSHNDEMLLLALRNDCWQAFETLYEKYKDSLYRHAYQKLKDREQVKDVVHEIFLSVWEKRKTAIIHTKFSAYLYQAVRYKIIDIIDKKETTEAYIRHFQQYIEETSANRTDHLVREKMLSAAIQEEIAELPPKMREVFRLSRENNLTYKHIGKQLGISEQSVRSHVKNALRILRSRLTNILWILCCLYF